MINPSRRRIQGGELTDSGNSGIRSWRLPPEQAGRDRRPGYFSVTGNFIVLPDGEPNGPESAERDLASD